MAPKRALRKGSKMPTHGSKDQSEVDVTDSDTLRSESSTIPTSLITMPDPAFAARSRRPQRTAATVAIGKLKSLGVENPVVDDSDLSELFHATESGTDTTDALGATADEEDEQDIDTESESDANNLSSRKRKKVSTDLPQLLSASEVPRVEAFLRPSQSRKKGEKRLS
jgi:hypothetical protein